MATCILHLSQIFKKVCDSKLQILVGSVRDASKKAGSSTQNAGNRGRKSNKGWKRVTGNAVTAGTTLAIQYNLRYCPGLNVGIGGRGHIYAKVQGKVLITSEKTDFDPEQVHVKKWYGNHAGVIYKRYYNVIPEPQHNSFKLIEQI